MTYGQLFTVMNPDVRIRKNGTCMWLYFDDFNHYTIGTEWWNKEISDHAIAMLRDECIITPELLSFDEQAFELVYFEYKCPVCGKIFEREVHFCPNCGRAVKWDDSF